MLNVVSDPSVHFALPQPFQNRMEILISSSGACTTLHSKRTMAAIYSRINKAQPFYDKYNWLLKPWSLPVSLRAGTLIVFEATFHCFRYKNRKVRWLTSFFDHTLNLNRSTSSMSSRWKSWQSRHWLRLHWLSPVFPTWETTTMKVLTLTAEAPICWDLESRGHVSIEWRR